MKNRLLKILMAIICIPVLLVSACSSKDSKLDTINLSTYYQEKVSSTIYGQTKKVESSLSSLTAKEPAMKEIGQYTSFTLTANPAWIYKMYIDYIYFYVYTNIDVATQMTINVSITNLASENDLTNPSDDFTADCSLIPEKNGTFLCKVKVQKVVATATGSEVTFDILNTPEVFYDEYAQENNFKWIIYGLEFHAESRAYSK